MVGPKHESPKNQNEKWVVSMREVGKQELEAGGEGEGKRKEKQEEEQQQQEGGGDNACSDVRAAVRPISTRFGKNLGWMRGRVPGWGLPVTDASLFPLASPLSHFMSLVHVPSFPLFISV